MAAVPAAFAAESPRSRTGASFDFNVTFSDTGSGMSGNTQLFATTVFEYPLPYQETRYYLDDSNGHVDVERQVDTGAFYGFTAARFDCPIPEPGTWTLMLGGLGVLALAARRRSTPCSLATRAGNRAAGHRTT